VSRERVALAVIGGSGLYDLPGVERLRRVRPRTPFGFPSDEIVLGVLAGVRCAFLPRHGRGHRLLPSEVPSRANIYALKSLGVERIVGVGAVGSLREDVAPGDFLVPDQVVDRTHLRPATFFGGGIVAHVALDRPLCPSLAEKMAGAARAAGARTHVGGTYLCMEGPGFSTKAESNFHRAQGFSVVGMTLAPEHKLAREAQLCYASVSLVTDYDVWKEGEEVSAGKVVATLMANVERVKRMLPLLLPRLTGPRDCACGDALRDAVFTAPAARAVAARRRLALLLPRP
jgi:5'-methylthioadenosine phosphorylase